MRRRTFATSIRRLLVVMVFVVAFLSLTPAPDVDADPNAGWGIINQSANGYSCTSFGAHSSYYVPSLDTWVATASSFKHTCYSVYNCILAAVPLLWACASQGDANADLYYLGMATNSRHTNCFGLFNCSGYYTLRHQ